MELVAYLINGLMVQCKRSDPEPIAAAHANERETHIAVGRKLFMNEYFV